MGRPSRSIAFVGIGCVACSVRWGAESFLASPGGSHGSQAAAPCAAGTRACALRGSRHQDGFLRGEGRALETLVAASMGAAAVAMARQRWRRRDEAAVGCCAEGRKVGSVKPGQKGKGEALSLKPPRGTRDFYPEDMRRQQWLFGLWKETAAEFGFDMYDAPVLENLELYLRKAGEEITEQLYNFVDKGDRAVALRPEMTPSLARMVLAKARQLTFPLKWFSIPQCWRYERPGKGRNREHYQWNMDIWGVEGVAAEAELLGAMTTFMKRVGLTAADVKIRVNSREIIREVLAKSNVPDELFNEACVALDKFDKLTREKLMEELLSSGIPEEAASTLLGHIDGATGLTNPEDLKPLLGEDSCAVKQLIELFEYAEAYGYRDWLVPDLSVVRGLAYYTGIVFEAFDRKGEFRAITGGGRYDKLLGTFGGENVPAVGFGFGDAVIVDLLEAKGLLPKDTGSGVEVVVFAQEESLLVPAARVAAQLRSAGLKTDLLFGVKKVKAGLKHCNRVGATTAVMLLEDEWAKGDVVVKYLDRGEQTTVAEDGLLQVMQKDLQA
eukprot:TRINITY_DN90570_c0_g1_i1.p1 TRINITY_DN90570_c0_g1~~TRINITY_DN90570_c0_g1_i1.p1  ORF type:complete len:554 (+),score=128.42 TRINITY_DN90570_c0_g1_i1:79-1740(+)